MAVELIRYAVDAERAGAFVDAHRRGGRQLDADPHCRPREATRSRKEPADFIVRIERDPLQGHLEGFRAGPGFRKSFAAVRPFYGDVLEMVHHERVAAGGPAAGESTTSDTPSGAATPPTAAP